MVFAPIFTSRIPSQFDFLLRYCRVYRALLLLQWGTFTLWVPFLKAFFNQVLEWNEMLENSAAERDWGAWLMESWVWWKAWKFTRVKYINISLSPFLQPGQVPLNSSLALLHFEFGLSLCSLDCFVPFVLSKLQRDKPNSSLIYSIEVHELDTFTILQHYSACQHVPLCMHTHPHLRRLRRCNNWNRNTAEFGERAAISEDQGIHSKPKVTRALGFPDFDSLDCTLKRQQLLTS